jgi:hypothetical protein
VAPGSTQLRTEMSNRNLPEGKGRPARKADNLTAFWEPIVYNSVGQLNTSRGPNLTYRTPSRARSSVSFRRAAREYCPPPPKLSQLQTVKKTTAFKPTCLNFTLGQ